MKTFDKNGHISVTGYEALLSGGADGSERLAMAEHLDRCDLCVDRYSLLLTDGVLMTPPEEIAGTVMATLRRRLITVFTGRAAKVCTAACLAIVIWCGGIFDGGIMETGQAFSRRVAAGGMSFSRTVSGFGDAIGGWLSGLSINTRGEDHAR